MNLKKNYQKIKNQDLPVGRIKPPNNRYTLDDMIPIIKRNPNVKFFVSNVESKNDLIIFRKTT